MLWVLKLCQGKTQQFEFVPLINRIESSSCSISNRPLSSSMCVMSFLFRNPVIWTSSLTQNKYYTLHESEWRFATAEWTKCCNLSFLFSLRYSLLQQCSWGPILFSLQESCSKIKVRLILIDLNSSASYIVSSIREKSEDCWCKNFQGSTWSISGLANQSETKSNISYWVTAKNHIIRMGTHTITPSLPHPYTYLCSSRSGVSKYVLARH